MTRTNLDKHKKELDDFIKVLSVLVATSEMVAHGAVLSSVNTKEIEQCKVNSGIRELVHAGSVSSCKEDNGDGCQCLPGEKQCTQCEPEHIQHKRQ